MSQAPTLERYLEQLGAYLGGKRLRHSQCTAEAARELAERFAPELAGQAELAGMLHDNAKRLSDSELIALARRFDIEVTPGERAWPNLLHGKVGAALLKERFGVKDALLAQAVADHVTGRPNMGLLSRILFVADQAAADRDFDGVEKLREVAKLDLEAAVLLVAQYKLRYVIARGRPVEPATVALYNEYCRGQVDDGGA